MAVATAVISEKFLNISAGTPIGVDWPMYEETDVKVYYGNAPLLAVYNTDYTVALDAGDGYNSFTLTPTASLLTKINDLIAADATETNYITVRSDIDYLTEATPDNVRYTPFTSREFDRTSRRFAQFEERLNRALVLSPNFVGDSSLLQLNEIEANRTLIVNAAGTAIEAGPTAGDIEGAQGYAAEAEASRTSAEVAQVAAEAAQTATEAAIDTKVSKTGDTMTGALVINGAPFGEESFAVTDYSSDGTNDLDKLFTKGVYTATGGTLNMATGLGADHRCLVVVEKREGTDTILQTLFQFPNSTDTPYTTETPMWVRHGFETSGDWSAWTKFKSSSYPGYFGADDDIDTADRSDNDDAFGEAETVAAGGRVDLRGKTWALSGTRDYAGHVNGYQQIENYEHTFPAKLPAHDTVPSFRLPLTQTYMYNAWAQDNLSIDPYSGTVYFAYTEADNHSPTGARSQNAVLLRMEDGVWKTKEYIDPTFGENYWVSASGWCDGYVFALRRLNSSNEYTFMAKRMSQRLELDGLLNAGNPTYGTDDFYVNYADIPDRYGKPALFEGHSAQINGFDSIGGKNINGMAECSYIRNTRIQFEHSEAFSSEELLGGGLGSIMFPESDWFNVTVAGDGPGGTLEDISDAINTWYTANVDGGGIGSCNLHSMVTVEGDAGTFYCGISGGNINVGVAKIRRPMDRNSNAYIEFVREITGAHTSLSEPTLARDPDTGNMYLMTRTQSSSVPVSLCWTDDDFVTQNLTTLGSGYNGIFYQSPTPLCIQDGKLYGVTSGSRIGPLDGTEGTQPAVVPIYLMQATLSDIESTGIQAFVDSVTVVDEVYYHNMYEGGSTAVGVGSLVAMGHGVIMATYGGEGVGTPDAADDSTSSPAQVYALKLHVNKAKFPRGNARLEMSMYSHQPLRWQYWSTSGKTNADGDYLKLNTKYTGSTEPDTFDTSTGIWTIPETGTYRIEAQDVCYLPGTSEDKYLELWDPVANSTYTEAWIAATYTAATGDGYASGTIYWDFKKGDQFALKVNATDGIRSSSVRNRVIVSKVM